MCHHDPVSIEITFVLSDLSLAHAYGSCEAYMKQDACYFLLGLYHVALGSPALVMDQFCSQRAAQYRPES